MLRPLSWTYRGVLWLRLGLYWLGLKRVYRAPVPVVVVGNVTVGGTGKTPLVIWLAHHFKSRGFKPAVVTRGYGGKARHWPQWVTAQSDPKQVGDEAVLIAERSLCPVVAGPNRVLAIKRLIQAHSVNLILCDDGLQRLDFVHDLDIVVIDATRGFGNGLLLPAGPCREPPARKGRRDLTVYHGESAEAHLSMCLAPTAWLKVDAKQSTQKPLTEFMAQSAHAVAGIGNPQRFFDLLRALGVRVQEHAYPDHFAFTSSDFDFGDDRPVLMTEKDAVKCRKFTLANAWALQVEAVVDTRFRAKIDAWRDARSAPKGKIP